MKQWPLLVCVVLVLACGVASAQIDVSRLRVLGEAGDLSAQLTLAKAYYLGSGVPKDAAEAVRWFRKAADQGEPQSQRILGLMYEAGSAGMVQDDVQAAFWFRKAAEKGDAEAQHGMARLCLTSTNPEVRDLRTGLEYARKAVSAHASDPAFLSTLALAYSLAGQLEEAVKTQQQALALAPPARQAEYAERLKDYQRVLNDGRPDPIR